MDIKQLELNAILDITQAINKNVEEKDLYKIFYFTCMANLRIPQIALVVNEGENYTTKINKSIDPNLECVHEVIELISTTDKKIIYINYQKGFEKAGVVMPIRHKKNVMAMIFIGKNHIDKYTEDDLNFVKTLGNIIMVAIENKRLVRTQLEQERMKKEMEIASEVQSYLVPEFLPKNNKITMEASYIPHFSVGGDYYDYIKLNDEKFLYCIADVSGKGVPAALMMSNFQATLRTMIRQTTDLDKIVKELNFQLHHNSHGQHFITFFIGMVDLKTGTMDYINAGHNPPVFLKKGLKEELLTNGTLLLGAFEELPFLNHGTVEVASGDMIFTYTDGITEVFNIQGEEYGEDRLSAFLEINRALDLNILHKKLIAELDEFRGEKNYTDDLTMLSLRLN
jgi:sigma-B regulation protein RsbU (phosphoserine phosphatase)